MWSTWYLKSRADLRQRWLQAAVLAAMLLTGTAAIALAFTVDRSTSQVIRGVHQQANSADVWLYGDSTALSRGAELSGVEQTSQLFATMDGKLIHDGEMHDAAIWGMSAAPAVAPGLLREGGWPGPDRDDEVVIGSGLARSADIEVGDRLVLLASNARAGSYRVVGVITPTIKVPYPQATPAAVFVSMRTVEELAGAAPSALSDTERAALNLQSAVGVRLAAPESAATFGLGISGVTTTTWQETRDAIVEESAGPPTMLRVFALFAVLACGFVVAATITNHAMAQEREIGLLKAVGFTPSQTAILLLAQMLAISIPSALLGIAIGVLATPLFQWSVTDLLDSPAARSVHVPTLIGVFVAVQLLVVVCALLPAWRAGRTRIVDAIAMGRRQVGASASLVARGTSRLRMPHVVVVGVKDTFTRPLRSWMTVAAIAVAAATLMMTFTFRHSIQRLTDNPALIGSKPYELQATRLDQLTPVTSNQAEIPTTVIPHQDAQDLVASHPGIAAFVTDRSGSANIAGVDVITHAIGSDVQAMGFTLAGGRLFAAPGEAIVGVGLAKALSIEPGARLSFEALPGQSRTVDVVGTYYADENDGRVLMYGLETLGALDPTIAPGDFDLRLSESADRETVLADIVRASGGRMAIADLTREADANISQGRRLVIPMTLLGAGLAVLAAANLLSSLVFSVRERSAEFGVLKAIGFTPRQIVSIVMAGVAPLALLGTVVGAPVGYWLIDLLMRSQAEKHQPSDIIVLPGTPWLAALVAIALAISFLGALFPALRAGRLSVSEALRAE